MDYTGPEVENEEVQEAMRRKRRSMLFGWPRLLLGSIRRWYPREKKPDKEASCNGSEKDDPSASINTAFPDQRPGIHRKHVSFHENVTTQVANLAPSPVENEIHSRGTSMDRTTTGIDTLWSTSPTANELPSTPGKFPISMAPPISPDSQAINGHLHPQLKAKIITFLKSFLNMPTIAILLAFPIALISPLKALFVLVPGTHISPAPDGQPPLAFLMDTATFIGAASVPIGLICLGSALARLKVPSGRWSSLPLGAITSFAVAKILITPVLGVLICESVFVRVGLIPKDNKVLRFVCMYAMALPMTCFILSSCFFQLFFLSSDSNHSGKDKLSSFLHNDLSKFLGVLDASLQWYWYRRASLCLPDSSIHPYVYIDDCSDSLYDTSSFLTSGIRFIRFTRQITCVQVLPSAKINSIYGNRFKFPPVPSLLFIEWLRMISTDISVHIFNMPS